MTVRYISIDILRAFAICLMVLVHFMENLGGAVWTPAGFGAPLFTVLVGVSYRLWVNSQESKGIDDSQITLISLRRALFLIVIGLAFNVLVWLPADTFNWDVLTLIGTAMLLLTAMRNMPVSVIIVLAIIAFMMGPAVRYLTGYDEFWLEGYFDPEWTVTDIFGGYVSTGYFPIFPWLAYPLVGLALGTIFFAREADKLPPTRTTMVVGAAMLTLAITMVQLRKAFPELLANQVLTGWTMFPPSVEYVTGSIGFALLLFAAGHRWIDPRAERLAETRLVRVASTFSKHSLSIYIAHHVMHLWPLWIWAIIQGKSATSMWRQVVPIWATIPLAGLCLVVLYLFFRWLDRTGRQGVEGWMRRLCG